MNQKTVGPKEYSSHNVISYLFFIKGSKESNILGPSDILRLWKIIFWNAKMFKMT